MAGANPDTHARNLNSNARLSVLLRTVFVVLAPRLLIPVLLNNHGGAVMMLFPAIAMLVTDHRDIQNSVIGSLSAVRKRSCLGRADEQAGSASPKRKCKFVHIGSSVLSYRRKLVTAGIKLVTAGIKEGGISWGA